MNKCKVCGKDSGKGRTCGPTCRSKLARSVANATVSDATVKKATVDATVKRPEGFGQADCQCQHCRNNRAGGSKHIINHGKYKTAAELGANELNRVSLPGDVDYSSDRDDVDDARHELNLVL